MIRIDTRIYQSKVAFVSLQGRLVLGDETRRFRIVMERLVASDCQTIALDLVRIERVDCAGLGELVRSYANGKRLNVEIVVFNPAGHVLDLLVLTKLVTLFPCMNDPVLTLAA
jgi:anti-anti-sigma factor